MPIDNEYDYIYNEMPDINLKKDWFHPGDKYSGSIKGRPFPKQETYHKAKKKKKNKMKKNSRRRNR